MSRDLTLAFATALGDQSLRPVIFFEGQFATGWVRIWSGLGEVSWNGENWAGAGSLLGLGSLDETGEVVAGGTAVSLSGVPLDLVDLPGKSGEHQLRNQEVFYGKREQTDAGVSA